MSSHCSSEQISDMMVRPRDQNFPGNSSKACPLGYNHGKAAQMSTKDQEAWLHLRPCLIPSWCGARRTIWDCWKPLVIFNPPRLLPSESSWEESRVWKWLNVCIEHHSLVLYVIFPYGLKPRERNTPIFWKHEVRRHQEFVWAREHFNVRKTSDIVGICIDVLDCLFTAWRGWFGTPDIQADA